MKKRIFIYIIFSFLFFESFSQSIDSCLSLKEGFIVEITQQIRNESQLTKSIDYLYFTENPNIEKKDDPLSLYYKGGQLVNISYYNSVNFKRSMIGDLKRFDTNPLDEIRNRDFIFQTYRIVMVYTIHIESINDLVSYNMTSHSYSYLKNLDQNQLDKKAEIIYPSIIQNW